MQVTLFGWVFLPLALIVVIWARTWLPGLLVGSAVFQAAAVVNIPVGGGMYGIPPYVAIVGMACMVFFWRLWGPDKSSVWPPAHVRVPALWLLAYFAVALVGSFVLPHVFAGVPVQPPLDPNGYYYILTELPPLRWGISNLAQALNLCVNAAAAFFIWQAMGRSDWSEQKIYLGFGLAAVVALVAGLHDRWALLTGSARMANFWLSNLGYAQVDAQAYPHYFSSPKGSIFGDSVNFILHRISSPFSEPSYGSAFWVSIYAGILWVMFFLKEYKKYVFLLLVLAFFGLVNTLGSTGLVMGLVVTLFAFIFWIWREIQEEWNAFFYLKDFRGWLLFKIAMASAVILLLSYSSIPSRVAAVGDQLIVQKAMVLKNDGRYKSDARAIGLVQATYGFGTGIGSNRTSSFITSLLSNTGILGFVAFFGFLIALLWRYIKASKLSPVQYFIMAALVAGLLALSLAIPDLNLPFFWGLIFLAFAACPKNVCKPSQNSAEAA